MLSFSGGKIFGQEPDRPCWTDWSWNLDQRHHRQYRWIGVHWCHPWYQSSRLMCFIASKSPTWAPSFTPWELADVGDFWLWSCSVCYWGNEQSTDHEGTCKHPLVSGVLMRAEHAPGACHKSGANVGWAIDRPWRHLQASASLWSSDVCGARTRQVPQKWRKHWIHLEVSGELDGGCCHTLILFERAQQHHVDILVLYDRAYDLSIHSTS